MRVGNYSVNLDWLAFSVTLLPSAEENVSHTFTLVPPNGYRVDLLPGNNIYRQRAIIRTDKGQRMLTLLYQPYSKILNPFLCLVEVDNMSLYDGNWRTSFDLVSQLHDCTCNNLSRVDFCCDFNPTDEQNVIMEGIVNSSVYLKRYKRRTIFSTVEKEDIVYHDAYCINWGNNTSAIKWKLYNKVFELLGSNSKTGTVSKPYIFDVWRQDGIDCESPIWRLEVSVSYAAAYLDKSKDAPITLEQLLDKSIASYFSSLYQSRFILRKNEGHKKSQNDTQVNLLNLPYSEMDIKKKEYSKREEDYSLVEPLRALIRQMEKPEVRYNRQMLTIIQQAIYDTIIEGQLERYFVQTYRMQITDMFEQANKDCEAKIIDLQGSMSIDKMIS